MICPKTEQLGRDFGGQDGLIRKHLAGIGSCTRLPVEKRANNPFYPAPIHVLFTYYYHFQEFFATRKCKKMKLFQGKRDVLFFAKCECPVCASLSVYALPWFRLAILSHGRASGLLALSTYAQSLCNDNH